MAPAAWKLVKSLFSRGLKAEELGAQLKRLESERDNLRYDQRALDKQRAAAFERAKLARRRGDNTEVVYHLQELKNLDTENNLLLNEVGRINKAMIILRQYKRRLDRVERDSDYSQVARLIERFRNSGAMAQIESASVSEEIFQEMLDEELEELDREMGFTSDFSALPDEMKDKLDKLDAVIEAEREGDQGAARKVRESLNLYGSDLDLGTEEDSSDLSAQDDAKIRRRLSVEEEEEGAGGGGSPSGRG
jgi:outer membrane murein-binding lipoprotein Lpp